MQDVVRIYGTMIHHLEDYPNDEKENERLDLQHNLMLLTLHEKLGLAPPNDQDFRVQRVLDVGTGTGLWAIDFADEHPDAEISLQFIQHRISSPVGILSFKKVTCDLSATMELSHVSMLFQDCPSLVKVVEEAGFVDVKLTKFKWPLNPWAKDDHYKLLGEWTEENFMEGIEAWTLAPLTRALEWTREEVLVFLTQVRKELRDRSIHAYLPIFVIHGRKPLQAGGEGEQ
ncbi:Secondary metabolism regulator LAE1 [Colletotrichum sp. SAR 10_98]|nr:Secondary metabolism regulator LAE1 [Colletotrichum sp. SAR 10_98]